MNPRFTTFQKKRLARILLAAGMLLLLAGVIPAFRPALLAGFKLPLDILTFVKHEVDAVVSYRVNFSQCQALQRQIDALRQKLNGANEIYLENERLRKLLEFKSSASFGVIAARVIASSSDNWSTLIIINKGKSSGIKKGYVVITNLGLVGRVVECSGSTSKVMLLSDTNVCASAIVQRSREEGLVCGTLGKFLIMRYLPKESDILVSDTIVTSGQSEMYPKGLLIGSVVDVGEEFSGLSRYATIKPAVNLSNLEEVLVVMP